MSGDLTLAAVVVLAAGAVLGVVLILVVVLVAVHAVLRAVLGVILVLVAVLILVLVVVLVLITVLIHRKILQVSFCGKPLGLDCPEIQDLSFGLNKRLASNPAAIAAVMPPAVAFSPPVKIPKKPSLSIASRTPFASVLPNPIRGTDAPAPANSTSGS